MAAFQQQRPSLPQLERPALNTKLKGRCGPLFLSTTSSTAVASSAAAPSNAVEAQHKAPRCPFAFAHNTNNTAKLRKISNELVTNETPKPKRHLRTILLTAVFNWKRRVTKPIISGLYVYWNLKQKSKVPAKTVSLARQIDDQNSAEYQYIDTLYGLLKKTRRRFLFVTGGNTDPPTIEEKLHYITRVQAQEFAQLQTHMMVPTTHPEFSPDYQYVTTLFWKTKNGMTYDEFVLDLNPRSLFQAFGAIQDIVDQFQLNCVMSLTNQYYYPEDNDNNTSSSENAKKEQSFKQMVATHQRMGIRNKDFDALSSGAHEVMHRILEDATHNNLLSSERRDELADFFMQRFANDFTRTACVTPV